MANSEEVPADLGLKIGTKDQVLWESVAKEAKILIEQSENSLKIQTAMLKLAEEKIEAEKQKIKDVDL